MIEKLRDQAYLVLGNAYSPYSGIKVAAAILTSKGDIYTGVNIENSSYGLSICAERSALINAVSAGDNAIKAMAVITDSPVVKSPCGSCRQMLFEFNPKLEIHFYGPDGYYKLFHLEELLPEGFSL